MGWGDMKLDVVVIKAIIGSCSCLAVFGLFVFGAAGLALLVLEFIER